MAKFTSVTLLFLLVALVGHVLTFPLFQRDVSQLEQDLELFHGDLDTLSDAINEYSNPNPKGPRPQSSFFPSAFQTTNGDLQTCINDINSITVIDTNNAAIVLRLVQDFTPTITGVLYHLRKKKHIFQELGLVPFILSQVETLNGGVTNLLGKLENVVPSQSQSVAQGLQAQMGPDFQQTIQEYS